MTDQNENPPTFQEMMGPITTAITNNLQSSRQYYIPTFSGSNTEDPVRFMRNFKRVADALSWNDEQKLLKFPTYLTGDAETFYYVNVDIVPETNKPSNFNTLEELFTNHFSKGDYKSHLMQILHDRKQKPGESLVTFVTNIRAICWDIDPRWDEKRVINYMYNGMNIQAAKDIILMNPKTIQELVEFAKRVDHARGFEKIYENDKKLKNKIIGRIGTLNENESSKAENSTLRNNSNEKSELQKMMANLMKNNNRNYNPNKNSYGRGNFRGNFKNNRSRFNNSNSNNNNQNLYKNKQYIYPCHGCGQIGHYIRDCQNRQNKNNNVRQENIQAQNESKPNKNENPKNIKSRNNKVLSITNEEKNLIFIDVKINDKKQLKALIDCGAEISLIKYEIAEELNLNIMNYDGVDIVNVSGESLNPLGLAEIKITLKLIDGTFANRKFNFIVVEKLPADILLGNNFNIISNLTIKCKKKKVKCNGKLVVDMKDDQNKSFGNIHCSEKTRIPKRTLALIDINSDKQLIKKNKSLFIYVNDQLYNHTKINVKNIILKPRKSVAMLQVANLNNFDVELKKGTILAKYEIINDEDVTEFDFNEKNLNKIEIDCVVNNEGKFEEEFEENDFEDNIEAETIELFNGEIKIGKNLTKEQKNEIISLLKEYPNLWTFDDEIIGDIKNYEHKIPTGNAKPIAQTPTRCSFKEMELIDREVEKLLKIGVIRPSNSPWAARTVMIMREDRRPRLCVDYRELNKITVRDQYPLPDIQMCIKSLSGGKYFSSLDCNKAFHQIRIYPEDIQKTAFVTPSGKFYEFVRLPFGLHNSPSSYQRVVDLTLSGLKYSEIASFIDDILVFGSTFDEHNERLKTVLTRMNDAGFTLRAPKCQIALNKVVFLGQLIMRDGVRPAGKLLKSIKEFPVPFDQRSVRAFLGLVGFFRKYCENFARISKPLVDLTRENIKFEWNEKHESAFRILRRKLMSKPILAHYDPKRLTRLDCDASLTGISGILMQHYENGYKPIGFYSRLLRGAEKNYAIYDLEVLAVVQSLKHFRDMLWGIKFILYTDNQAVSYVKNKKDLIGRLARARMDMEEYEFEIYYKPGTLNGAADCLSRYPAGWKLMNEKYEKSTINNIICFSENLNIKDLIRLQREDKNLKMIIDMLKNQEVLSKKKLKFVSKFSLQNDVLYKQVFINGYPRLVICIPQKLRFDVLRNYHDLLPNAHLGYFKTVNKIRERFWWKNMDSFIRQYLRTCDLCERRKVPRTKPSGLAQPIVVHDKWEYVGLDFKGPLKRSKGFEFIIVLTCSFTKYAIAKPTRKADAKTVAKFLFNDVMCIYGCPKVIITDRAQCFMGKVFKEFNKLLGIKHVKSSGFHPTTNSITERFNDVLGVCLTMYCNKNQTNWSDFVLPVVFGYNSARHPITKYSPYELMFGKQPTLPTDTNLQLDEMGISNIHQFNRSQIIYMIKISNEVRGRIQVAQSKNKKYFDAKHKDVIFDVGDMVLIQNKTIVPETSQKLIPKYVGPYKILEQISPVLYKLDFIPKVNQSNIFHVSRLKKYFDRNEFIKAMEIDEGKLKNFENIEKSFRIQKKIKQPFKSSKLPNDGNNNEIKKNI